MTKPRPLSTRQEAYIKGIASGLTSKEAALQAGYGKSYSVSAGKRLLKAPAVKAAIEEVRMKGRNMAAYDLAQALKDCDSAAEFSRTHKNSMALVKACELKSKLAGLLVERVETVCVDIRAALDEAKRRVTYRESLESLPAPTEQGEVSFRDRPPLPGVIDPFAD
jgi:hypothetical protein